MLVVLIVEISYMPAQKLALAVSYDDWTPTRPVYFAGEDIHFAWCTGVPIPS